MNNYVHRSCFPWFARPHVRLTKPTQIAELPGWGVRHIRGGHLGRSRPVLRRLVQVSYGWPRVGGALDLRAFAGARGRRATRSRPALAPRGRHATPAWLPPAPRGLRRRAFGGFDWQNRALFQFFGRHVVSCGCKTAGQGLARFRPAPPALKTANENCISWPIQGGDFWKSARFCQDRPRFPCAMAHAGRGGGGGRIAGDGRRLVPGFTRPTASWASARPAGARGSGARGRTDNRAAAASDPWKSGT